MILTRDETSRLVVNLRTPDGEDELLGTGVFVIKGNNQPFLVTASHVAATCNNKTRLIIADAHGNATPLDLMALNVKGAWRHHDTADVAALRIQMNSRLAPVLCNRFFPFSQIRTARSPVSRDVELTTVGFPNGLGTEGAFAPLTFRSHAASSYVTLTRRDVGTTSKFFLLENPSVEGYSGAPVFGVETAGDEKTAAGPRGTVCYGLVHGTIADETGGKLGAVSPGFFLADLFQ